jgi:phosphoglycolate phosphatase-like HAD superfamily hydrolase
MVLAQDADVATALPSWNPGVATQALVQYVRKVTREGSPDFIPVPERIAVFDNDGTLWPENPLPFQGVFVLQALQQKVRQQPELAENPHVKATLAGDINALMADHGKGLFAVLALVHDGVTVDEFERQVNDWISTAKHPRFGRRYVECVYQPMLEVLAYVRANGFKTFIVSGGGADFMRVWSERVYGIPPEQVIGSHGGAKFELRDGNPVLVKNTSTLFIDKGGEAGGYSPVDRPASRDVLRQQRRRQGDAGIHDHQQPPRQFRDDPAPHRCRTGIRLRRAAQEHGEAGRGAGGCREAGLGGGRHETGLQTRVPVRPVSGAEPQCGAPHAPRTR